MITNAIYLARCQDLFPRLPSDTFTIVYLDPPFFGGTRNWGGTDPSNADLQDYFDFLVEVFWQSHRALAENGTLFVHLEPQNSGYIRVMLDRIFGSGNFRSELVLPGNRARFRRGPGSDHRSILLYTKSNEFIYNPPMRRLTDAEIEKRFHYGDERARYYRKNLIGPVTRPSLVYEWHGILPPDGRSWVVTKERLNQLHDEGRVDFGLSKSLPSLKVYLSDEAPMAQVGSIWDDLPFRPGKDESEPFVTQKPLALLERVVKMSSNPGDIVLDPFCGSGTTMVAAQRCGRRWIGCDTYEEAYSITLLRLEKKLELVPNTDFEVGDLQVLKSRYPDLHRVVPQPDLGVPSLWLGDGAHANSVPYIMTEGKTDWKHLKAAYVRLIEAGYLEDLEVEFHEYEKDEMGDAELLKICQAFAKKDSGHPIVCIFDRDNPSIVRRVTEDNGTHKTWGNRVYSLALPVPGHRNQTPGISIELYYRDEEIKQRDSGGRRLYLSDEFNNRTGRHVTEDVHCPALSRVRRPASIIDDMVFDRNNDNVALSKNDFANHVLLREPNFDVFDLSEFERLFQLILDITRTTH